MGPPAVRRGVLIALAATSYPPSWPPSCILATKHTFFASDRAGGAPGRSTTWSTTCRLDTSSDLPNSACRTSSGCTDPVRDPAPSTKDLAAAQNGQQPPSATPEQKSAARCPNECPPRGRGHGSDEVNPPPAADLSTERRCLRVLGDFAQGNNYMGARNCCADLGVCSRTAHQ